MKEMRRQKEQLLFLCIGHVYFTQKSVEATGARYAIMDSFAGPMKFFEEVVGECYAS